jgi:hypothetical protein
VVTGVTRDGVKFRPGLTGVSARVGADDEDKGQWNKLK